MVGIKVVEPAQVPVIDFQTLSAGTPQERKDALQQLDDAFQSVGLIYLSNHSIGQDLVEEAFSWSKRFFDLPDDVKALVQHPHDISNHRGWAAAGTTVSSQGVWDQDEIERIRETGPAEKREVLETGDPYPSKIPNPHFIPNRVLPEEILPGFEAFTKKWWDACIEQELQLLQFLCEILGIPDKDFLGKQQNPNFNRSAFGWNHYLSTPARALAAGEATRLNAHTDYGQFTLLFQDMSGGLELEDEEAGIFRPVLPKPGTVIVQVADMLERQSNGRWKSSLHQVSTPHHLKYGNVGDATLIERYSIGFFIQPDFDLVIKPLPGCEAKGRWSSLEWEDEITAGDWLNRRVALEYQRKDSSKSAA
ncbi:Oxoglutarate/iron-dependent dioxygenase [Penicillium coprophilum]|uniref:Oxoglutarate/iron-dependent dioxygenase n=1 Tax=Penicillium coprophilum TaxID=36646 RepID=UPI0023A5C61D|nr:Oxoglutarate/iron-dependent dioxygenase [Penicillium coprophilum]KAJ5170830.1 Oxoglutarate/iron-dependent dioxygenase [Penicillium coprophilum]